MPVAYADMRRSFDNIRQESSTAEFNIIQSYVNRAHTLLRDTSGQMEFGLLNRADKQHELLNGMTADLAERLRIEKGYDVPAASKLDQIRFISGFYGLNMGELSEVLKRDGSAYTHAANMNSAARARHAVQSSLMHVPFDGLQLSDAASLIPAASLNTLVDHTRIADVKTLQELLMASLSGANMQDYVMNKPFAI